MMQMSEITLTVMWHQSRFLHHLSLPYVLYVFFLFVFLFLGCD